VQVVLVELAVTAFQAVVVAEMTQQLETISVVTAVMV
jgi:hypothetical protein